MSQRWLNLVRDAGPEHPEVCAYVRVLADYANDQGVSWPSIETLARYMRVTKRTVYRRQRMAQADGWITIRSGGGRHRSNVYTLVSGRFVTLVHAPPETVTETVTQTVTETVTPVRETVTVVHRNGDTGVTPSPRTAIEASSSPAAGTLPVVVGVAQADDDEVREALHGIRNVTASRLVVELVGIALRDRGHTATSLNRYLRERFTGNVGNPMGLLIAALRETPANVVEVAQPQATGPDCHICSLSEAECRRRPGDHEFTPPPGHDRDAASAAASEADQADTPRGRASGAAANKRDPAPVSYNDLKAAVTNGHTHDVDPDWLRKYKQRTG